MELLDRLDEFLREYYYADLLKAAKDEKALILDFALLDRFDPLTSDQLLEKPDDILKIFDEAAERTIGEKIHVRVRNLPDSRQIRIRSLRAKHMGHFWTIDAIIKMAAEVKPQISAATFECPECAAKIVMPQEGSIVQKPNQCECGRRGDFKLVGKDMYDVRWLTGVEPFELTTGEQPGQIAILLKEDLTTPKMQKKTDPGARLKISGVVKELPKRIKGKLSTKMDMYVEANHVESSDVEFDELDISPEDEKLIRDLAADPLIYEKLRASIAPGIYGFDEIKESVALQLFGGIPHILPDGTRIRGNIHILITGDPGVGKSVVGSSKILHNSDDNPEYTTIAEMVDAVLEKGKFVMNNDTEVSTDNSKNIKVLALNPENLHVEWKPVTAFIRHKSPEYLVKVLTKSGREVIATEDHSFVVMDKNGDLLNLQGSSLKNGMFLPVPLNTHKEMNKEIKIPQAIRKNAKKLPESIRLDWNFGFFLGMFLSEGSLDKGNIKIEAHDCTRKAKLKEFTDSIGFKSNINAARLMVPSRNLSRFLENTCYKGEKTKTGKGSGAARKCIPDFCFYAPKDFIYGLLSGLLSGDGYFQNARPTAGRTKGNLKVGYATISENLAHGLLDILSLSGIFAVFRKKKYKYKSENRSIYEVIVLGNHTKNLLEKISMIGKTNREIERFSEKDAFDAMPCTGLLYDIVRILGYSKRLTKDSAKRRAFAAMMRTVKSRNRIGRRRLERIYKELLNEAEGQNNKSALEKLSKLERIIKGNVIWDYVENVERIKSQENYVYDLSVDGHETFVVNNIIVHNTALLKLVSTIVPRGRYVSGSGVSGAGLTATVIKNEAIGGWVLEAGALILCNKGLISIDEFDKMNRDDQIAMHEATSVETVSIAKASIIATLPAQTAVLAGANPKRGRFDPYLSIAEQIDIPETLLSRFDLKFALRDIPDRVMDEKLADHIITSRISPEFIEPPIDPKLLRKFIAFAKRNEKIEFLPEAAEILKKFYVEMRNMYPGEDVQVISITLRQYEALMRLAEASAKIRLDDRVRITDAERAIRLMKFSLQQLGYDIEAGRIDIDRMESGVTATKRRKISVIIEILERLEKELGGKEVPVDDLKAEAETQGVETVDDIIDKLIQEGTIFQPKPGFVRKVRV